MKKILYFLMAVGSLSFLNLIGADPALAEGAWTHESEVGMIIAAGNTEAKTINAKELTTYTVEKNIFKNSGSYLRSKSAGVESANAWSLGLRYERELSPRFNIYLGETVDGDKFQAIKQRYSTDIGGKYFFKKEDQLKWFAETGYRFTKENRYSGKYDLHYLRAYTEVEYKFNESVSSKYWLEFLPNLTQSKDYQVNSELSLNAAVSSVFSVKTGYLVRFDNVPAAGVAKKTDRVLTTALVAKF